VGWGGERGTHEPKPGGVVGDNQTRILTEEKFTVYVGGGGGVRGGGGEGGGGQGIMPLSNEHEPGVWRKTEKTGERAWVV